MKTVGMMLKCDRCPEEVFVIRNKCRPGYGSDSDVIVEEFEDSPKGWNVVPGGGANSDGYNLCEECSKKYNEMWLDFWVFGAVRTPKINPGKAAESIQRIRPKGATGYSKTVTDWCNENGVDVSIMFPKSSKGDSL